MDVKGTTVGQKKSRGRRLRSLQNCRALIAHVLRQVEADTALKAGERHRLLLNGAVELAKIIALIAEHGEVEQQLAELERRYAELERQRMAS